MTNLDEFVIQLDSWIFENRGKPKKVFMSKDFYESLALELEIDLDNDDFDEYDDINIIVKEDINESFYFK